MNDIIDEATSFENSENHPVFDATEIVILNKAGIHEKFLPKIVKNNNKSIGIEIPYFERIYNDKSSHVYVDTKPSIEGEFQCSESSLPASNFCNIKCIKFNGKHAHYLCYMCNIVQAGTFADSSRSMELHNSMYHLEVRLSKNHRTLMLEDTHLLSYTQANCFISLDIRNQEVYNFLDLQQVKGVPNCSSVKNKLFKKIEKFLGIDRDTKTRVSNFISDHIEVLGEAYEFLTDPYKEATKELFEVDEVRQYFGTLIKVVVTKDIDYTKIKKSETGVYRDKKKNSSFTI